MKKWLLKANQEGVNNLDIIALFIIMPTLFYLLCLILTYKQ
jgi:hypothetical protein